MLVVISPAKRLNWDPIEGPTTEPEFQEDAVRLAKTARNLTLAELRRLMDLSADLAKLNRDRFKAFEEAPSDEVTRPAVHAFAGDTYVGLDAASLEEDEMVWAQAHLRILSGLYGVLRPLDAMQPYRLEMGSRLKTRRGKSLYDYWRQFPAKALRAQAEALQSDTLVNCASQEYFGAVDLKALKLRVITPVFMEERNGEAKIVSFFAKKARGSMARYIIHNRLNDAEGLKEFDYGGYRYQPEMSEGDRWVFVRDYPDA